MWALAGTALRRKLLDTQAPTAQVPPVLNRKPQVEEHKQQQLRKAPPDMPIPTEAKSMASLFNIKWNPTAVHGPAPNVSACATPHAESVYASTNHRRELASEDTAESCNAESFAQRTPLPPS
eukprot:2076613-Pleurochrysis_carterae.AAC.1